MYLSRKVDYALILVNALKPTFASGGFVSVREVARQHRLPYAYLEKLAAILKRAGVLEAQTGKNGGYCLAEDPRRLTVQAIIDLFQPRLTTRCINAPDNGGCPLANHCPTRLGWTKADAAIRKTLNKFTVADL